LTIHGSGLNTCRYLYASDAANAFDTALHEGIVGEIYNIDSADKINNLSLARILLSHFKIDVTIAREQDKLIQHTAGRPFNDMRYAVDARKLRSLGWKQEVFLENRLARTVEWYDKYDEGWWGDVSGCLSAFPEVIDDLGVEGHAREIGNF
jgi:dTDP-D-glucose 4,6-dehydratase